MNISRLRADSITSQQRRWHRTKAIQFVREVFPTHPICGDGIALTTFVDVVIERAASYRVQTGAGFAQLLALMLLVGEDFDSEQSIRIYMLRDDVDGDVKIDLLMDEITRRMRAFATA